MALGWLRSVSGDGVEVRAEHTRARLRRGVAHHARKEAAGVSGRDGRVAASAESGEELLDALRVGDDRADGESPSAAHAGANVDLKRSAQERRPIHSRCGGVQLAIEKPLPVVAGGDRRGDELPFGTGECRSGEVRDEQSIGEAAEMNGETGIQHHRGDDSRSVRQADDDRSLDRSRDPFFDCFYCMDSHGAFASALLRRASVDGIDALVDGVKAGRSDGVSAKVRALLHVARTVQRNAREVTSADIAGAIAAGATDADTQLTVLIASAFCMYNRIVDGLRAKTPPSADAYRARAEEIADYGYSDPRLRSLPG
jgi:hypothetical protein